MRIVQTLETQAWNGNNFIERAKETIAVLLTVYLFNVVEPVGTHTSESPHQGKLDGCVKSYHFVTHVYTVADV